MVSKVNSNFTFINRGLKKGIAIYPKKLLNAKSAFSTQYNSFLSGWFFLHLQVLAKIPFPPLWLLHLSQMIWVCTCNILYFLLSQKFSVSINCLYTDILSWVQDCLIHSLSPTSSITFSINKGTVNVLNEWNTKVCIGKGSF